MGGVVAADYLSELAAFVTETPPSAVPAEALALGQLILADCIGCMVAGNQAPEMRRLIAHEGARAGRGEVASVVGTHHRLAVDAAAFVNGTAGTWHDLDEGNLHTRTHAAIQLVPAALAEAEVLRLSGRALLVAMVLAYEAAARLWRATSVRLAVHPHGTYGPLAAALALCRLGRVDAARCCQVMNIAMTMGLASSRRTLADGATVRNFYTGHSGRAGFEARALADMGFTGEGDAPASILGEIYGSAFDPAAVVSGLGSTWWIRRNYFKRFASGRYVHGALDALEAILARAGGGLAADTIQRIDVATYFMAASMGQHWAPTQFGLRFSIPAAIARRILLGREPLTDEGSRAFKDPAVKALAARIFVTEDPAATAAYPDRQPTRLRLTFRDGRETTEVCDRILGESDNPLPAEALLEKFMALTSPAWGEPAARAAWAALAAIEGLDDVGAMTETWVAAASRRHEEESQ
ncbi:MAG: MmgE/PrpD family protein [Alphaproteobacteria bacterium]|nr:MmgE/PrpD family protein [Alphaproteobacteria bacterium]